MLVKQNKILENESFASRNFKIIFLFLLVAVAFLFIIWSYKSPMAEIFIPPIP